MDATEQLNEDDEEVPHGWHRWYSERRKKYYYHNDLTGEVVTFSILFYFFILPIFPFKMKLGVNSVFFAGSKDSSQSRSNI
jgi:hypothetical protein